jgi:hypothetical protein
LSRTIEINIEKVRKRGGGAARIDQRAATIYLQRWNLMRCENGPYSRDLLLNRLSQLLRLEVAAAMWRLTIQFALKITDWRSHCAASF